MKRKLFTGQSAATLRGLDTQRESPHGSWLSTVPKSPVSFGFMRLGYIILFVLSLIACLVCYSFGYRSGTRESPNEREMRGRLTLSVYAHRFAEQTNWPKVNRILDVQVLGLTRTYEERFGTNLGTNSFAGILREAQHISQRVQTNLVSVKSLVDSIKAAERTNANR